MTDKTEAERVRELAEMLASPHTGEEKIYGHEIDEIVAALRAHADSLERPALEQPLTSRLDVLHEAQGFYLAVIEKFGLSGWVKESSFDGLHERLEEAIKRAPHEPLTESPFKAMNDLVSRYVLDYELRDCDENGGDGTDGHDCGEDTCCCFGPEDNVTCDICRGEGGFLVCPSCYPEAE